MAKRVYGTAQVMAAMAEEKPLAQLIAETERDIAKYRQEIDILENALYAAEKELNDLYDLCEYDIDDVE